MMHNNNIYHYINEEIRKVKLLDSRSEFCNRNLKNFSTTKLTYELQAIHGQIQRENREKKNLRDVTEFFVLQIRDILISQISAFKAKKNNAIPLMYQLRACCTYFSV